MDFEFHYYITGIVANKAGFSEKESTIIAHSSQLVDNNTTIFTIAKDTEDEYTNYISQTINILKPRKTLMRIYPIFHFIPGDPMAKSARRRDGKMHILNTTPDSELAQEVLSKAFEATVKNILYRIGVASHTYTDSWSHQNFAGFNDSFNGFSLNPIPNIGHSDALLNPDRVCRKWTDERLLKSEVDNNNRFISAAGGLFYKYTNVLGSRFDWKPVKELLLAIMDIDRQDKRLKLYQTIVPWLVPYDEHYWFDKAVDQKVRGLKDSRNEFISKLTLFKDKYSWKRNKEDTDWFKFQEAVKEQQSDILPLVNNICNKMDVDIKLF